jgi:predicted nucleic acid-binding protein
METADRFVLDGSVTIAWSFEDESSEYADGVFDSLSDSVAVVPAIWALEVTNALLMGERRSRSTQMQTEETIAVLEILPITVDDSGPGLAFREVLGVARAQNLSSYDAAYLELSVRRGLPLATIDTRLRNAAAMVGVPLYAPPVRDVS